MRRAIIATILLGTVLPAYAQQSPVYGCYVLEPPADGYVTLGIAMDNALSIGTASLGTTSTR